MNQIQFKGELTLPFIELEANHIQLQLLNHTVEHKLPIQSSVSSNKYHTTDFYEPDHTWCKFEMIFDLMFLINANQLEIQTPKSIQKLVDQQIRSLDLGNLLVDANNQPILLHNGLVPEFVKNSQYKKLLIDHQFSLNVLVALPIYCREDEILKFKQVKPMAIETPRILTKTYGSFDEIPKADKGQFISYLDQRAFKDDVWKDAILTNDFHILKDTAEPLFQKFLKEIQNLENWSILPADVSHLGMDPSQQITQL